MHASAMDSARAANLISRLACGQFRVEIVGDLSVPSKIRQSWAPFQLCFDAEQPDLSLKLENTLTAGNKPFEEGWNASNNQKRDCAIYSTEQEPVFALIYEDLMSEVTVRVRTASIKSVLLGVQYGIMLGLSQKCVGLHGVTLLCEDEIVILSAPSGTGKTTLAHLLENFSEAIVINGDFALLSVAPDGVVFEPTPFCGSSGRCLNYRVRVNRVVFLKQSPTNQWRTITSREAINWFMDNSFIPTWDNRIKQRVQENILKCVSMLKVNEFSFAPTSEAAEIFSEQLRFDRA